MENPADVLGTVTQVHKNDKQYCHNLGLIWLDPVGLVVANEIYQKIIPCGLTESHQHNFLNRFQLRHIW